MKTKLFAILLFAMSYISVTAQQYKSVFGSESTSWNQLFRGTNGDFTDSLYVVGDTIINSKKYRIIDVLGGETSSVYKNEYYLYETADHSKVYQYFPEKSHPYMLKREFLVMDLNLNVNDSFQLESGYSNDILDKTTVDSVFIDIQNRKHIRFANSFVHDLWSEKERFEFIESVGTTIGLAYQSKNFYFAFKENYILCNHHNDTVNYFSKISGGRCSRFLRTNLIEIKEDCYKVEYNQNNSMLTIKSTNIDLGDYNLEIYNANGKLIRNFININLPFKYNMNIQIKGIYLVLLKNKERVFNQKIIVP